ncbi:FAD/NAD(P)-binding protein [Paraburkholderia caribensis]|uniref:FAD/NAD(P)-binding protein n=1 Tax=Paraburkholderia caribensis TaxID=75105 RepID=UPI00159068FA|nr:FAD/NAD(P)-binding protein [Paraburkholderia caribensis]
MSRTIPIAVIGMGPRGLTVLERLLEFANQIPVGVTLAITVFDPNDCGQGVHSAKQPDHLLINTVASQVTMFAPQSRLGRDGSPSLVEWARIEGYRVVGGVFRRVPEGEGRAITDADHLPRRLLGEYLSWICERIVVALPRNVTIAYRRSMVVDLLPLQNGYQVIEQHGIPHTAQFVFLTTGHGRRQPSEVDERYARFAKRHFFKNPDLAYLATPYPVEMLDEVAAHTTVAIQGFGLTAHDVISTLTLGRGGYYVERNGELVYEKSGLEPRMLLVSRQCLPFSARGINQKGLTGRHEARFFTPAAVAKLREAAFEATGDQRIDFRVDVLPLVIKEMAYAYRAASQRGAVDAESFEPSSAELAAVGQILWPLSDREFSSFDDFREFFYRILRDDLDHALRGNLVSPVKAATDVLRDTREALRAAVEYGGLTPESHRYFIEEFNAITNRVSFGPPLRRNREFLALHAAGLIDVAGGPGALVIDDDASARFRIECRYGERIDRWYADVLVSARLDSYSPLTDASPLSAALLARGIARPYVNGNYHPGGIEIDTKLHPVGPDGKSGTRLWAIGFPVEGAHFYTHALPRPGIVSRQTSDAACCVQELLDAIVAESVVAASTLAPIELPPSPVCCDSTVVAIEED